LVMLHQQLPYRSVFTKGVKYLIIINAVIFLLQLLNILGDTNYYDFLKSIFPEQLIPVKYQQMPLPRMEAFFALRFFCVTRLYYIWQPLTYMFLHSPVEITHILFNMLGLFIFGRELEQYWGTRTFIKYYLICGIGAGLFILALDALQYWMGNIPAAGTLGASGAIFGIMIAYALFYPDRQIILLFPPIPIKVKWFVLIYGGLQFVMLLSPGAGSISYAGHAGGMLTGFLYFRFNRKNGKYMIPNTTLDNFFNYIKKLFFPEKNFKSRIYKTDYELNNFNEKEMSDYEIELKIDQLLDKISNKGLKSLSMEEKLFLDRVAPDFKHKFPE